MPRRGKLVRKAFEAWDPAPELGLEFVWEGTGTGDGVINGEGRLVWRDKGAPAYDVNAVYSDYRGAVKNGRPDGDGRLKLRNGLVYEGGWRDGAMAGEGRSALCQWRGLRGRLRRRRARRRRAA